jgi:hypothetical protein
LKVIGVPTLQQAGSPLKHLLPVDRRDPDEEFSLQTEGSATVTSIGTQQQKHEAISPPTPSFSVLQNSGFGIQGYIERMDNVRFLFIPRFSGLKKVLATRKSHHPR